MAVASLAAHAVVTGRLERARRLAGETLALAGERGWVRTWPVGLAEAALSSVALERNRREDALAHFRRADELLTHASDVPLRMAMMMQRARLAVAEGRPEPALEALERAAELSEGWPVMPAMRGLAAGLEAISRAALGGPAAAEAQLRNGAGQPATSEQAAALARLRLLAGDPAGAHAALAPWLDRAADAYGPTAVELWLLEALAHDAGREPEPAAAALERALDEAEPHGIRRPFVELGTPVATLLRRQLRQGSGHRSLVETLLQELARPAADARPRSLLVEPLSDREAAVLRFLPTMMSNGEIAAELFVSINTVKTHLKSIYRKLDVPDRREAVRRARELGLLAP